MKPTIPEASHRSISPISSRLTSGTEILYLPHPVPIAIGSERAIPTSPRGGIIGNTEAEPSGNDIDSKNDLIAWHTIYVKRIALIVGPLMVGQLILSGWHLYQGQSIFALVIFIILILLWGFTFAHFAPLHQRISNGAVDASLLNRLETRNWIRTGLWTLIFILGMLQTYFYPIA